MDKAIIRKTMLSLEADALHSARQHYLDYVSDARLDRSEPIEDDEQAQAELASDLSEALDDSIRDHTDKIAKLETVDFGAKSTVEEGALVKLSGKYFIIAVSTAKFSCNGKDIIGISTMSPIYNEMQGMRAGDSLEFSGRKLVIEEIV
jgi:hypothetical protein